ncbi:hypothetical protein A1351_00270 [Methylosinus sp. R-45379]|jgi:hypothetical protein|uniref:DUF3108 domain-containing protein n=1 Tax=unclassified Methylosinus TaxID=2624500 RepID=UPI00046329AE|nr:MULTISPECIES: DUF3108 domain-containing protein [unclassified Methylosinus]OAI31818.1 hypothetical protein A1351_00270 [Methylosinus sp. R-45379]TDX67409.1 uncharacterized protein DUF3108 [Methylosinus sp. sav-2]
MAFLSSVQGGAGRGRAVALAFPGLVTLAALAAAAPCGAETLKANFALSLLGLSIGHASANGVIEGRNYRIDISMRTTGLASLVNDTRGAATASGALSSEGLTPTSYANTTSNTYETRTVRMSLAGNSVRAVHVDPTPWDLPVRIPVTESNKSHITDPVSALIMSVPASEPLVGPSACNRTIPVFDGVTRFDVTLSFVEMRNVETHGYSGPVSVCAARYRPIAGHRPDSVSTRFMAENSDITVWLAPLQTAHAVVPYRMALRTNVGMLTVEPAEFHLGGRRQAAERSSPERSAPERSAADQ